MQVVGGPDLARQLLAACLVDELSIDIMTVLLGGGLRLFQGEQSEVRLEKLGVQEVGARTSLTFRVVGSGQAPPGHHGA